MSVVTNCILNLGILGDDKLDAVNEFFEDKTRGFVDVDEISDGWYGGSKYLETSISIGAFNHLDLPGLIAHIRTIKFEAPESVQLLVLGQQDDGFEIINVFGETS